jgi:hypothetical protein
MALHSGVPPYGIYFIENPHNKTPNMILYFSNSILIKRNINPMQDTIPVLSKHDYYVSIFDFNLNRTQYNLSYENLANLMRPAQDTTEYNQYQLNDHFGYKYGIDFFESRIELANNLVRKMLSHTFS